MQLSVHPLSEERRADFYRVHAGENGAGNCFCVAWWVSSWKDWPQRPAEQNRAMREELFQRREYDGYLLYSEGEPVGWCQTGLRDRLEKLTRQYQLEPDPETFAITCFEILPRYRRRGLAHFLLRKVLEDLKRRGVRRVEAFPKRGEGLDFEEVWTGPEDLFKKAGFSVGRDDPLRPVYVKHLG